jgi:hypothetical protein
VNPAGVVFREHAGKRVAVVKAGAADAQGAIDRASSYLARRGVMASYLSHSGGHRLKVGVPGLRLYSVMFSVTP